jgi:ribosome biogenesis GTPase A
MTKARRELAARMTTQDLVVEVLDARLPAASANRSSPSCVVSGRA